MDALYKLGIDWKSIAIYAVNYGLLFFILSRYLYKPVIKFLDERRDIIKSSLNEAEILKQEFQKKQQSMAKDQIKAEQKLKEEMEKLKKFTQEKQAELMKDMELTRAQMLEQAQAEIEKKTGEIMHQAEKQTAELIKKIVLHIVHHKIPENVVAESIQEAWKEIA